MPLLDPHILERQLNVRATAAMTGDQREILRRAELLPPRDRLLVRLSLNNGVSRRQLGEVLNLRPGSVTRRLQRLGARLNDPLVVALLREDCPLAPEYRQLGVEHFLQRSEERRVGKEGRSRWVPAH